MAETEMKGQAVDPHEVKLSNKRVSLVEEHGKAVQELRAAEIRVNEMRALLERISGAIAVIDELLADEKKYKPYG